MKKIALKSLTIFLIFMFLCTVVSRAADSLTVAKVTVETASAKKIEHIVKANGMVEKNRELAVITEADLLVKTVFVSEGEKVEENAVLAQVDLSQLEEVMQGIRNEIKILELQNTQAKETEAAAQKSKATTQKRANEDYNRAVQENTAAVQQAQKELQDAKEALSAYEASQKSRTDKQLGQEKDTADSQKDSELSGNSQEGASSGTTTQSAEDDKSGLESLQAEVKRTQEAYDTAVAAYQQAIREAGRLMEDADDTVISKDVSIESNQITIEEKQNKLQKLEKIKQNEGKITAPVSGIITQISLFVGQKTSDTAAFTMADISSGMRFVAEISKEDGKYVQVGDEVTLEITGKKLTQLNVEAIEQKQEGDGLRVTVLLPPDSLSIGDSATMSVVKQSELYETTVPYSAIHSEDGRDYVYVAEQQETILGEEYIVRALEVDILDKNEIYAALSEMTVNSETKIITESDRYIEPGSRVRLQNQ